MMTARELSAPAASNGLEGRLSLPGRQVLVLVYFLREREREVAGAFLNLLRFCLDTQLGQGWSLSEL
jgi:hypothetical protein